MKKIKVNRSIHWTETFVSELVNEGIKYACISPGSRNTPLTYSFVTNKRIKSFSIIDERSCGFFALGLSKSTRKPVLLICTSGTATAEFYPAIIEAYQSKTPLIVCTADRPASLRSTGANQTINQNNIYKNHIRWFIDAGLPKLTSESIWRIKCIARQAYNEAAIKNIGPVHINFPFKEPFEPDSFTDEVQENQIDLAEKIFIPLNLSNHKSEVLDSSHFHSIAKKISNFNHGIIAVGFDYYTKDFYTACIKLSKKLGFPIFADVASNFRTIGSNNTNMLTHYNSYLQLEKFIKDHQPNFIIQFGRNFTSKALTQFIQQCKCEKLLVNEFGEWKNQKDDSITVIAIKPETFCRELSGSLGISPLRTDALSTPNKEWLNGFGELEKTASSVKKDLFEQASFPNETRIVSEVINAIPNNSNLMVSNSLPIRDLDLVLPIMKKKVNIFHNRGASGIDGIVSTALGIAQSSKQRTYLLIGDVAFYYDMNSLLTAKKYSIPLKIILINNNGGRIFEMLPISKLKSTINNYFITPHNLDFKKIVNAFGIRYHRVKSWNDFKDILLTNSDSTISLLEIKTEPLMSLSLRNNYYKKVKEAYNKKSKALR